MVSVLRKIVMIAVLVATALSLSSCLWFFSAFNQATIGGVDVELTHAVVLDFGSELGGTISYILLMSDGMDFDVYDGPTGTGDLVLLVVVATGPGLVEATYPFNEDPSGPSALLGGEAFRGWNVAAETAEVDMVFSAGQLTIEEVLVGDWLLEWDCSGTDYESGGETTTAGKMRLSEDDVVFEEVPAL